MSIDRKLLLQQEILDLEEQLEEESRLLERLLTEEEYAQSETSFYRYYVAAWSQFETVPFLSNWHLEAMAEHLQAVYSGQIQNLLVNVPPRTSKCLAADTPVILEDRVVPIEHVNVFDKVKSVGNKTDLIVWKEYSGKQWVSQITLANGNQVKATNNHKFLTPRGFRAVEDLTLEDTLICKSRPSPITEIHRDIDFLPTYDIQTAKYNCFQVDKGLISHNSSMINVAFPTWVWLKSPSTKFITASNSESLAVRDSVRSRSIIQSPWYQGKWGMRYQLKADVNQKSKYENNRHGYRIATSIGGRAIGEGFDILLCDDPHKPIEVVSKKGREAVIDWWTNTMSSRANSPDSKRILIMQRLHEEDLAGFILENYRDEWEHLCLPMEYIPTTYTTCLGFQDPRKKENECLWPQRFPPDTLLSLKRNLREFGTASQLQQKPVPLGGGMVKKSWLRWYDTPLSTSDFNYLIASWDLSFGADGDYSVGTVWGIKDTSRYLLDLYRGQWDIVGQLQNILHMAEMYPSLHAILVEDRANGRGVVDMLSRKIPRLIKVDPKVIGGGDKEVRLAACCPDIEGGYVYFPQHNLKKWMGEVEHELTNFPRAKRDDIVDSISQALNWVNQSSIARTSRQVSLEVLEKKWEDPLVKALPPSTSFSNVSFGELRQIF